METDLSLEHALVGALLRHPPAVDRVGTLTSSDFTDPRAGWVFDAVRAAVDEQPTGVDIYVVVERLRTAGLLSKLDNGMAVHGWYGLPCAGDLGWYAQQIRQASLVRQVSIVGQRLQQAAEDGHDFDQVLDTAARLLLDLQVTVDAPTEESAPVHGLSGLGEFVDMADSPHNAIIPGVLNRQDRVIVVASEGSGKSTLARQVAVMVAAGMNPFTGQPIPAQRTLLIDLENPVDLVRQKTRPLVARARNLGVWSDDHAFRWTKPGGLDVRRPGDARLLERVIAETRPALVCIGPLYKLFAARTGDSAEVAADEVRQVLDRLRERYGVALWIEAHAPLKQGQGSRELRPFGSALWSRWPEFGIALRRHERAGDSVVRVEQFRGHRDERSWPVGLVRDSAWPWRAVFDETELDVLAGGR